FVLAPRKEHYCCMVSLLGRAGHLAHAEELLHSMPFVPEALDWTCLLSACHAHRDAELGAKAAKLVIGMDPHHGAAYVLLTNTHRS
ncbi:hypothetical protein SELMODRAFT_49196, partial [Selaginella moellendorffii]